jgi:hypothetical protein
VEEDLLDGADLAILDKAAQLGDLEIFKDFLSFYFKK